MTREKITSKTKDKLQENMDKLFMELTGKKNRPKLSWVQYSIEEIFARREKVKNGKRKFQK